MSLAADSPCRLCGGGSSPVLSVGDRNRGLGDGVFEYRRCEVCGTIFLARVPDDLGRYYASEGYGTPEDSQSKLFRRREEARLGLVSRFASRGMFARAASAAGFDVTAIEMDPEYCRQLSAVPGIDVIESSDPAAVLPTLERSAVITMWHVIEHLADPASVLERSVQNLEPGGLLAISTPNPGSLQFRLLGRHWVHLDAPRHLQLIPARALEERLRTLGMRRALITTTDSVGLECNRMGWEHAVRLHPARRPSTRLTLATSGAITVMLSGLERRGLAGATYTSLFIREAPGT
jgi:Methyltransferase domain